MRYIFYENELYFSLLIGKNGLDNGVHFIGPLEMKRSWIERDNEQISIRRQCALLGLNRATLYYQAESVSDEDIRMMRLIDEIYTCCPFLWLT